MLRDKVRTAGAVRLNEIYPSLQGEGLLAGTPSVFVRLQGCNLRCSWCDQPLALEKSDNFVEIDSIVDEVKSFGVRHVVITGGEPFFEPNLDKLILSFLLENLSVQIETNGTLWNPGVEPFAEEVHITLSPKAAANFFVHGSVLKYAKELKFVVDESLTVEDIVKGNFLPFLRKGKVILQPEGNRNSMLEKAKEIAYALSRKGLAVRVLPQLHKILGIR